MRTFTVVNDDVLVEAIRRARERIVYVAPGVSEAAARALSDRCADLGASITLILDVDPEVYRMGYGDLKGLELIKNFADSYGLELRQQRGVRIGLLIADGQTLIYAPTPQLIEAGSIQPEKPNGIAIAIPLPSVERACGVTPDSNLSQSEVGSEAVTPQAVQQMLDNLEAQPPKPFDLARVQRVFSSRVQFVEFEVLNYRLSGRPIEIPKDLLVSDEDTQRRLRNTFKLFDADKAPSVTIDADVISPEGVRKSVKGMTYSQRVLEQDSKRIRDNYLLLVEPFGRMIFREQRPKFDAEASAFMTRIEAYGKALQLLLKGKSTQHTKSILDGLVAAIVARPLPARYQLEGIERRNRKAVREKLAQDLSLAFDDLLGGVEPRVMTIFKDVSYQSLSDKNFRKALQEALERKGRKEVFNELFSEFDAAREKSSAPPREAAV